MSPHLAALPALLVPQRGLLEVVPVGHHDLQGDIMRYYVRTAGVMTDLLALLQVLCDHHRGDQPELGMLEHHELGVGLEAVVGLVGERGAVAVLTLNRDVILYSEVCIWKRRST